MPHDYSRCCDDVIIYLAEGADNGAYDLLETINEGDGPPPHIHENGSELFYILEGEVDVEVGDNKERLKPGGCAFVPPNTRHFYKKVGPGPHRMLLIYSPAGFAGFFREMGRSMPTAKDFDPELFAEISARYKQRVVN